ncbi:MAG: ABC transporter substrate-binding protein [Clostridia bacterium]
MHRAEYNKCTQAGRGFRTGFLRQDIRLLENHSVQALIIEDSSYETSIANGATEEAQKLGLNIVAHENCNKNITYMTLMVLKVKAANPNIIFAVSYVNDEVLLYDTLKQQNAIPKVLFGGGAGFADPNFSKTVGANANGLFVIDMPYI